MGFAHDCATIFNRAIQDYHLQDDVDQSRPEPMRDPFEANLYHKAWIDTVQWHLEDIIRDPDIVPAIGMQVKRRIDKSNQDRTDMVESIDTHFITQYAQVTVAPDARLNTESPAWALDRLAILCLKIYHMREEVQRSDVDEDHLMKCQNKLDILSLQQEDLLTAIDALLEDIAAGRVQMRSYRQMKMYNDPALNPVLYKTGQP